MKKRLLGILLCLAMLLTMLPAAALATDEIATDIPDRIGAPDQTIVNLDRIWVNGVELHPGEYLAENSDEPTTTPLTDNYAYWAGNNSLTLKNFDVTKSHTYKDGELEFTTGIFSTQDVIINCIGNNTITNTNDLGEGITGYYCNIAIVGDALEITADGGIITWGFMNEYNVMESGYVEISSVQLDIDAYDCGIFAAASVNFDASVVDIKTFTGFDLLIDSGGLDITNSDVILFNNSDHTDYEKTANVYVVNGFVYIDSSIFDFDGADIAVCQDCIGMSIENSTGYIRAMDIGIFTNRELNLVNTNLDIDTDFVAVYCLNGSINMDHFMKILSPADGRILTMYVDDSADTWDTFATYRGDPCDSVSLIAGFVDVKPNAFYYDATQWAVEQGITNGMTPTTFAPDAPCTRGQVVTFLWRAVGEPAPTTAANPFNDTSSRAFYYKAMQWAVESKVTNGMSPTSFAPDATCTRGQVVTFLWRTMGKPQPASTDCPFTDVSSGAYYYKAMLWALENNITDGMSPTTFAPDAPCTRGQVVTFLYRTMYSPPQ